MMVLVLYIGESNLKYIFLKKIIFNILFLELNNNNNNNNNNKPLASCVNDLDSGNLMPYISII